MNGSDFGSRPALGLDIELDSSGALTSARPVDWDEWFMLPVRSGDLSIKTKSKDVRIPTVVLRPSYSKMPVKRPKLTSASIMNRDGGICQYSGKKLSKKEGNVDHVTPKSRGGKDDWTNMVWCDRGLNSHKSDRLNHEIGLKLLRQPKAPPAVPASVLVKPLHPTHTPFL